MKATGIVRRIDYKVIICARLEALKKQGVFADFCPTIQTKIYRIIDNRREVNHRSVKQIILHRASVCNDIIDNPVLFCK